MKNVLVTGGSGYKGSILVGELLKKGYTVNVLDNFMYGYDSLLEYASYSTFTATNKDIRNINSNDVSKYDIIFHLAALSGYEACKANPYSAKSINVDSTKKLVDLLSKNQLLVYASTTSMFGKSGKMQDETAKIYPTSIYGQTKYEAEKICMDKQNSVAFRFATIFGVSKKMRPELLLNDFVYLAVNHRNIVLFDANSKRTFLHIKDAINAYLSVVDDPDNFKNEIFNFGSNKMNFSKLEIANKIREFFDFEIINSSLKDVDRRDFIINFDKISKLGYKSEISIESGIKELIGLYSWFKRYSSFNTI